MLNKKLNRILAPIKVLIICIIILPIFLVKVNASSEYNLKLEKGYKITWQYTEVNNSLIQQINTNYNNTIFCIKDSNIKENSKITHIIEKIDELSDSWKLRISYKFEGESNEKLKDLKIYKNPEKTSNDWLYEINDLKLRYVPSDVNEYLNELAKKDYISSNITVKSEMSFQIRINLKCNNDTLDSEIFYENNGIINEFKLELNENIALKYEKTELVENKLTIDAYFIFLIIILVIPLICLVIIFVWIINLRTRKRLKDKDPSLWKQKISKPYLQTDGQEDGTLSNKGPIPISLTKQNPYESIQESNSKEIYERYEIFDDDENFYGFLNKDTENHHDLEINSDLKMYCPMCGAKRHIRGKYCYYCGIKIED
jgi:hypothetical protein